MLVAIKVHVLIQFVIACLDMEVLCVVINSVSIIVMVMENVMRKDFALVP